jgi:hypothetical protein
MRSKAKNVLVGHVRLSDMGGFGPSFFTLSNVPLLEEPYEKQEVSECT